MAHICLHEEKRNEQLVKDHCRNVAKYTSDNLASIGFEKLGYLVGLVHDMGKYSDGFATYLEAAFRGEKVHRGSVNHSFAGVIFLLERYQANRKRSFSTMACEIGAYAVGAHHGEFDAVSLDSRSGFEHRLEANREELEYTKVVSRFIDDCSSIKELDSLFEEATKEVQLFFTLAHNMADQGCMKQDKSDFLLGMLTRMVLSALIHADRRDTAEFMNQTTYRTNKANKAIWNDQLSYMETKLSRFNSDTPINLVRGAISEQCLQAAMRGDGIYKISVPTGAGKTLSTLRYALALAKETNKEHIIFIIPLLSVLDQNSYVIRDYISDQDLILEHHSNVLHTQEGKELDRYELLAETWDAPIIVSTLYQLLMNLFSDKTTAIRRMQALKNSIIVLDEAQSLPFKMTYQFNMAVNFLVTFCNTTVVLSSATQPSFEKVKIPIWFSENPDLISLTDEMTQVFRRTEIINKMKPEGMDLLELTELSLSLLGKNQSILIIGNTKKTAKELYNKLKLQNTEEEYQLFHLSTSMCTRHRRDTIREIKECLAANCKMICVATQLVEAGIDFSFESVIRICAGMDNIAQAAGRCNRNNEFGHVCMVYIVKLQGENLSRLKDIKIAQDCTQNLLYAYKKNPQRFKEDLLSEESLSFYYEELFYQLEQEKLLEYPVHNKSGEEELLFELLAHNKKHNERPEYHGNYFLKQSFKTAGSMFSVYDTNTTDILVPYNEEAKELIADLLSEKAQYDMGFLKECLNKVKQYSIQVWEYQKEKLDDEGLIYSDLSGHFFALQPQCYNRETGLDEDDYMF